jgi:hypothetical protein
MLIKVLIFNIKIFKTNVSLVVYDAVSSGIKPVIVGSKLL